MGAETYSRIEQRLDRDGFPELVRHWRTFLKQRSAHDLQIEARSLLARTMRHARPMLGHPAMYTASLFLAAVPLSWLYAGWLTEQFFGNPFHASITCTVAFFLAFIWSTINLILLGVYLLTWIQRYLVEPLEPLLADWVGWMLTRSIQSEPIALRPACRLDVDPDIDGVDFLRLESIGWTRWIVRNDEEWQSSIPRSPHDVLRQPLLDVLGAKDPVTRKFVPGRFMSSLRSGKASVTRFCELHALDLAHSREASIDLARAAELLRELLTELSPDSEVYHRIADVLSKASLGIYVDDHTLVASLWGRDPFVDLTHQKEFFSSASLRGVDRMGRSSKGRLGTFGYLLNPSITAIDFSIGSKRMVRARLAKATTHRREDATQVEFLYVDGVEGTNAIACAAIHGTLVSFANHCKLAGVLYNAYPYNRTPLRMVRWARERGESVQCELRYGDDSRLEYLDGFGFPIEPFEYSFPRGDVIGIWFPVVTSQSIGRPPKFHRRLFLQFRTWSLWVLMGECLAFASFATFASAPWMLPVLAIVSVFGIYLHLRYQKLADRSDQCH